MTDRNWFLTAVVVYGLSCLYSILLWRRGFRRDDWVLYGLLLAGGAAHTTAMFQRGFSLARCPIHNLYEATAFIAWTVVASYLTFGWFHRWRFLGAFASPLLFAVGVFALMPALDQRQSKPHFDHGLQSLHAAFVLLSYGAFGLMAVSSLMYLSQSHDLKFHKLRAVTAFLPPIQRLEKITHWTLGTGVALLSFGLLAGVVYLRQSRGAYWSSDPFVLYCVFTWMLYFMLWVGVQFLAQTGRRLAWFSVGGFTFVILTFWGVWMLSGMHNPTAATNGTPPKSASSPPAPGLPKP